MLLSETFQQGALTGQGQGSLYDQVIEHHSIDQMRKAAWFLAYAISALWQSFEQNVARSGVHVLTSHSQRLLQACGINLEHRAEKVVKENRMPGLIDKLRCQVDAHLLLGRCQHIGRQGVGDAGFALEEGR